jgi:uncharacterized protein
MINPAKWTVLGTIRVYQWVISPMKRAFFGTTGCCRFSPTCSQYAWQAVHEHGVLKGSWLASGRLLRCHPWGGSGYDPVPLRGAK